MSAGLKPTTLPIAFEWTEAKLSAVCSRDNCFEWKLLHCPNTKQAGWHNITRKDLFLTCSGGVGWQNVTYFSFSLVGRAVVKELSHQALQSSQRSLFRCLHSDRRRRRRGEKKALITHIQSYYHHLNVWGFRQQPLSQCLQVLNRCHSKIHSTKWQKKKKKLGVYHWASPESLHFLFSLYNRNRTTVQSVSWGVKLGPTRPR